MHSIINHAEGFLGWIVQTSWQTAVLVCLILLAQFAFGKKLSPAWRYGLWMLVVVRLVLPSTFESAASVFNLARTPVVQRIAARVSPYEPAETVPSPVGAPALSAPQPTETAAVAPAAPAAAPAREAMPPTPALPTWSLRQGLVDIWIAVVLLMLVRVIYKNYRFSSFVVRRRPVTDEAVLTLLQDCKAEMNVHVPMDVVETRKLDSPALMGFIRPRLLMPPDMLKSFPRHELRYFFLHELAHFRRGDILVNWLMTVLQILHWFNPLVWLAFSRMRADREAACDAYVMSFCGDAQESRRYGEAIVDLVEFAARVHWLPGVAGILEDEKEMQRRITMIAKFTPYPRWTRVLAAGLVAALAVVALTDAQSPTPAVTEQATPSAIEQPAGGAETHKASAVPPGKIEVSGQLVVMDSAAVAVVEKKLGMDLDPETGRFLLSRDEAAGLLDALLAQESARLVGEGSTITMSGINSQTMSAQAMHYTTDKQWARHVGWIMNVTPILHPGREWVSLTVVPEWSDRLAMRKLRSGKEVPLFQSLNWTTSFGLPVDGFVLLRGSRAPLRELQNATYAESLSGATRDRSQDYFLFLSAGLIGENGSPRRTTPDGQALMVCRFLDLGPEAQKTLQTITGMSGLSGSAVLSAAKCGELLTALESAPDARTMALAPILAASGINCQVQWVQEVIYEKAGAFETRELGMTFNATPTIGPDGRRVDLTYVAELAFPPQNEDASEAYSPLSINTVQSLPIEMGQTVLSSISAGGGILEPRHRCFMAITVRSPGDDGVEGY